MTDSKYLKFETYLLEIKKPNQSPLLEKLVTNYDSKFIQKNDKEEFLTLEYCSNKKGLHLSWNKPGEKELKFFIDVEKFTSRLRSYPAAKQGAFNQCLGKKARHIVDSTGGWGGDALLMCSQGYRVTIIERNQLMALMLEDAMQRLSQTNWALKNKVVPPKVIHADALDFFTQLDSASIKQIDCVYLDPMFPPKRKTSAAANKYMQLLHSIVGPDLDASALLETILQINVNRVAVKRPDYAQPLFNEPTQRFSSKLVHYDVYL